MPRAVRCYAEGQDGDWEAICLDFDIAVQGDSFLEVFQSLNKAIGLYLEATTALSEPDRARLLNRSAPFGVKLKFLALAIRSLLGGRDGGGHHQFTIPLTA